MPFGSSHAELLQVRASLTTAKSSAAEGLRGIPSPPAPPSAGCSEPSEGGWVMSVHPVDIRRTNPLRSRQAIRERTTRRRMIGA